MCLIGMLQARLEIGDLEGFIIILGTLGIGVFVAIANDLVLILWGEDFQAVINGNPHIKTNRY